MSDNFNVAGIHMQSLRVITVNFTLTQAQSWPLLRQFTWLQVSCHQ